MANFGKNAYLCSRKAAKRLPTGDAPAAMQPAPVAELADAPDLGSGVPRREGSSPFRRTNKTLLDV